MEGFLEKSLKISCLEKLLYLCLTSHQQLRSYGDGGATAESLILQTGEAADGNCDPWFAVA